MVLRRSFARHVGVDVLKYPCSLVRSSSSLDELVVADTDSAWPDGRTLRGCMVFAVERDVEACIAPRMPRRLLGFERLSVPGYHTLKH
jgi:hypothetical protein